MSNILIFAISVLIALALSLILGESPWLVFESFFLGSFSTLPDLGYTLFYATPLIFTGLSVAVAFHAGLFNIGSEGQLYIGALAAVTVGIIFPNLPFGILFATLAAMMAGGLWFLIAGALRVYRGGHEVILTIMMNFIAYSFCNYMILNPLDNPESQSPESAVVAERYWMPTLGKLSEYAPVNLAFVIAVLVALIIYFLIYKTVWGFEVRVSGSQPEVAERSGIKMRTRILQAVFLSGAMSGLVALNEIMGHDHKFKDQFSGGAGFLGVAISLLARNNPIGIIATGLLFGLLQNGALHLELDSNKVTRDLAVVLQAILILVIVSKDYITKLMKSD